MSQWRQPEKGDDNLLFDQISPTTTWKRSKLDRGVYPKIYYVDLPLHTDVLEMLGL